MISLPLILFGLFDLFRHDAKPCQQLLVLFQCTKSSNKAIKCNKWLKHTHKNSPIEAIICPQIFYHYYLIFCKCIPWRSIVVVWRWNIMVTVFALDTHQNTHTHTHIFDRASSYSHSSSTFYVDLKLHNTREEAKQWLFKTHSSQNGQSSFPVLFFS